MPPTTHPTLQDNALKRGMDDSDEEDDDGDGAVSAGPHAVSLALCLEAADQKAGRCSSPRLLFAARLFAEARLSLTGTSPWF